MADPIGYLLQYTVNPKLDAIMSMVMIIGLTLIILMIITDFLGNKKLQTQLLDIQEKIKIFIEKKRTQAV
ncbi:MAG: hypothetical protein NTY91_01155 [Euryarchaeota archaeon]|jgi:hypothetical protein|nr:hypothetical protein [Euryarchaeota archaeon]